MPRILLVLALLIPIACSRESAVPAGPTATPAERSANHGRLIRRLEGGIGTLNFILHTTDAERQVLDYLHVPLIALGEDLKPVAGTATRWEIGDGGKTFTFHLDPRAAFSDGRPVTADDVLFTITRIVDEGSPQYAPMFDAFDRARSRAIDEKTVLIAFREARASQLMSFNIALLPKHVYGEGNFKQDFNDKVVGNGPYRLTRMIAGREVLLERRSDFWREPPPIATVLFRVVTDDGAAWLAAKSGQLDEMRVKPDVWAMEKDQPEVRQELTFHDVWPLSYNCIAWNVADERLSDPRVRRALAMAYDRDAIIKGLYRGEARPLTGPFTPDQAAYNANVPPVPFDLAGARALLAEAGWRDTDGDGIADRRGRKLQIELLFPAGHATAMQQAQAYQQTLKSIGVDFQLRPVDGSAMFEFIMGGKYQAAYMAWTNDPEPDLYPLFHSSQQAPQGMNVVRYRNRELDGLLERARVELDSARRAQLQHQAHEIIARDQPYLYTVQIATKWAVNQRVKNVNPAKGVGLFFWYPGPLAWSLTE